MDSDRFTRGLRASDACRKLGLARSAFYKLAAEPDFPQRRRLTARAVVWLEDELDEWLRSRQPVKGD